MIKNRMPASASQTRTRPSQPPPAAMAIGVQGDCVLPVGRAGQGALKDAGEGVPNTYRLVSRGRDQPPAVSDETDLVHGSAMSSHLPGGFLAFQRPPAEDWLVAGRDELFAVGANGQGQHVVIVVAVGALAFGRPGVEPLDRAVFARA